MYKEIHTGVGAQEGILRGVNAVADAVAVTLGPRGRTVIFNETIFPTVTKDGVTVAQQVFLEDNLENMGVMMAREAAEKTNREAGDGTTSTVVLLRALMNEGHKMVVAGTNPVLIKRGMDVALEQALNLVEGKKKEVTTFDEKRQIATISANNDPELGGLIAKVIEETGTNGIVTVTNSATADTEVEYVKGTKLDRGYASHMFINNSKSLSSDLESPVIILTTDKISMQSQLVEMLQSVLASGAKNLVLIAGSIEGPAVSFLTQNHLLGKFTCVPIAMPSFGDYQRDLFYDLAAATGAIVLGDEESTKLKDATIEDTGTCDYIKVARNSTIITGANGDISKRIEEIETLLENEKDGFRIEKLKERLGKLSGSIANIRVGGASETEQTEVKYRIEDALNSTKSAIEDGIVEGGGTTLLRSSEALVPGEDLTEEYLAGFNIVKKAMRTPSKQILDNAGLASDAIMAKVLESEDGYNTLTNEYQNLIDNGVIDPVRCVKNELKNAVATAGVLLTSGCAITHKPDGDSISD